MPSFDVELTLDEINAAVKSLSTSADVAARKLPHLRQGTRVHDEALAHYKHLSTALDEMRAVQHEALTGSPS